MKQSQTTEKRKTKESEKNKKTKDKSEQIKKPLLPKK